MAHWLTPRALRCSTADRWVRAFSTQPTNTQHQSNQPQQQPSPRQRYNNLANFDGAAFKLNPLLTPADVLSRERGLSRLRKPYTMELTIMVGKAKVHKSAVIRERCKRRLREAIRLVVTRGAGKKQEGEDVVYDEEKRGVRKWLVPGFMYIASVPSLELYRHSLPSLVSHTAAALAAIRTKAADKLLAKDLAQIDVPPVATRLHTRTADGDGPVA